VPERIERAEAPDEPAGRLSEPVHDELRRRLERLADGHPSSDHYQEADLSRPDGRADAFRADTHREETTGAGASRETTTGTRLDNSGETTTGTRLDNSGETTTGTRLDNSRDTAERAGSGWNTPDVRDHPDRPAEGDIRLPADRQRHILDGDGPGRPGGGHRHGTNKPGKTEFPERWTDEAIPQIVEDVARRPDSAERQRTGTWLVTGERDGVRVTSVALADGIIWSAWPAPAGAGVRQNPKQGAA
jgi:hypothetical protein